MPDPRFLICDIGGTNIRMATFAGDPRERKDETTYKFDAKTGKPYTVDEALAEYLGTYRHTFAAACLGVAGRVRNGDTVQITNRPDVIRRADVARALGVGEPQVMLVNDMPPHLACVDHLLPAERIEVKAGVSDPNGMRAVLMPGTGVGTGGAVALPGFGHLPFPSEGGHLDFAPRDDQQDALLRYFRQLISDHHGVAGFNGNVSNEHVFCGEGLRRIYAFLRDPQSVTTDGAPKPEEITAAAAGGTLPETDLRQQTVELYVKLVAAAAGNLALLLAATGGVYLGGSICLNLRRFLTTPLFADAFLNSGPPAHRPLLEEVPVRLIDYKDSGLLGAGVLAMTLV